MNNQVLLFLCLLIGICIGCIIVLGVEIHDLKNKVQRIINDFRYRIETLEDKIREIDNRF